MSENHSPPTESPPEHGTPYRIGIKRLRPPSGRDTPRRQRLREPQLLLRRWDSLYPMLVTLLGSPKRAEMTRSALRTQALRGDCFRSARNIAGAAFSSEKTWDRCLRFLVEKNLVTVTRLVKTNGKHSVNLIDFTTLWNILRQYIVRNVGLSRKIGGQLWRKVAGIWVNRDIILEAGEGALKLPQYGVKLLPDP